MNCRYNILLLLLIFTTSVFGQDRKNYFPLWTNHQENSNIHGISIGLGSFGDTPKNTYTNGIRIEIIGAGILVPLIPNSPIAANDSIFESLRMLPISEKINGLNLSTTGTFCNCTTNGLSAGFIGQINYKINGFSSSLMMNYAQIHNGFQMAIINESYLLNGLQFGLYNYGHKTKGVQFGLFNKSENLRGIQIGLWNVNQKRKLPLINWNFKK